MARDRNDAGSAAENTGGPEQAGAGRRDGSAGAGSLVRIRRRAAGLTQQELAELAQVSLGTVRDLEQGRTHRPGRDSMAKLAGALGLDAAGLQTLAQSMPEPARADGRWRSRGSGLQLKVLGPVEAWRNGTRVGLGEPRQRTVLALLALNPDVAVPRESLIDAVWPRDPPGNAAQLMQAYVSRLRRMLDPGRPARDPGGLLLSEGTCYRLRVAGDQLDWLAFGQLAADARAAVVACEPGAACDAYELGLGLWRGEPVADLGALRDHPAAVQASRARAVMVLEYAELADQVGHADLVLGHVMDLAAREPLNEKACARLMLTLAAVGQQAAALRAYEDLRLRLDEELGVLPGPELAGAHLRVLRQEVPASGVRTSAGRTGPTAEGRTDGLVHPPADTWVAAVHAREDDADPIGAGVVIDASRVLTCAHVVLSPDGAVRESLWVSFPKADGWPRRRVRAATVAGFLPAPDPPVQDLAVLVLAEPVPPGVEAAPLRCPRPADLAGRAWWAFGFPDRDPVGHCADGVVGAALALGWIRLDTPSDYLARPGFSGGGLWSPDYQAVVGIVGQAHPSGESRAITMHQADLCLPDHGLAALANWSTKAAGEVALHQWGWALARDPEGVRHWRPRARGVSIDSERGYRFRGRTVVLGQIAGWLDRGGADRRVLVVTGSPGVGKSAVLGRVVTTADAAIRASLPEGDEAIRASVGSVGCAVHAKAKTALEVAEEIARAASARLPEDPADLAPAIREALEGRGGQRFNVIIDALDEAASPAQARGIIDKVVLPLAETCSDAGAQVVVGTRRRDDGGDLLGRFGGALAAIDLDDPAYFAEEDLAAYALACLRLAGDERPGNPYADDAAATPLASKIAALAGRNFLIAGLIARSHGLHDQHATGPDQLLLPATVGSALAAYLERLHPVAGVPASQIMTTLAFAEAPGLPAGLWQLAVQALDGTRISAEDLTRFARSSAANFLVEAGNEGTEEGHGAGGGPVYRLFHQALNDALLRARSDVVPRADDERALTLAFIEHGRVSRWQDAPEYLLRSLPGHAAAAGLVDDLLCDDSYLLHADLRRLTQVADQATSAQGRRRARLIRLTPRTVTASPRDRAALFGVTEALDDLGASYRDGGWQAPYQTVWTSLQRGGERAAPEGHKGAVYAVCPVVVGGQELLASGGGDGTVRIWDPATGQQHAMLEGHQDGVGVVCPVVVGGQELLASGGGDGTVRIWDLATGQQRTTLTGHQGGIWSVCPVSLAGRQLLASGSEDGTVRIWDPVTGKQRTMLEGHQNIVCSVCPVTVAGRQLLASGGQHGTVRLWDPVTGQQHVIPESHQGGIFTVCPVTVAGRQMLASAGSGGTVRIWDPDAGQQHATLEGHRGVINVVCPVTVAGQELLASGGNDGSVRIWDPATGQQHTILEGHQGAINGVCPLAVAGQELLASGGSDGAVRIWDPGTGQQHAILKGHQHGVYSVCPVTVAGQELLASGGDDGTVRIWDPATGQQCAILEGHRGWVNSVCPVTVGGQVRLASGGKDGVVRIWDPGTGQQHAILEGHQNGVCSVCPVTVAGQQMLASGSGDDTVRIWDPATGQQCAILEGHHAGVTDVCPVTVAGQQMLASADGDGMVRIWDPQTGRQRSILEAPRVGVNGVCLVTIAGKELLASADDDGTVRIWDPETGACLLAIPTHYSPLAATWVAGSLAIGLGAGILVIKPNILG